MTVLSIDLSRSEKQPLAAQIYFSIREAIESGRLASGTKLPSWRDLSAQLGVSRGTVRIAYQRLIDEQFAVGLGAAGTRVADRASGMKVTSRVAGMRVTDRAAGTGVADRPVSSRASGFTKETPPLPDLFHDFGTIPLAFQMGVPSQKAFPAKLWSRILGEEARRFASGPVSYPDPRGDPELRTEISTYLGIARGIRCDPSQVLVTAGFTAALGLVIAELRLQGTHVWMEEPGFPLTRTALRLAGANLIAVPVDEEGLDVTAGIRNGIDPTLVVVTPGQQAPLGTTMSLQRRLALLAWARQNNVWIIEDDYLSELQLTGRAAPALASLDHGGRVLHIGSFSKTISPALRLGFLVVPPEMARHFGDLAACLTPAPAAIVQRAVAQFMRAGCYLRHLRRMKRLYAAQREALLHCLKELAGPLRVHATPGTAVMTLVPETASDIDIALSALPFGLAPAPLSPWYEGTSAKRGLLLGITNLDEGRLVSDCRRLVELVGQRM
jgi:GntR family transcriptional regulator/MocR family aminotransferase